MADCSTFLARRLLGFYAVEPTFCSDEIRCVVGGVASDRVCSSLCCRFLRRLAPTDFHRHIRMGWLWHCLVRLVYTWKCETRTSSPCCTMFTINASKGFCQWDWLLNSVCVCQKSGAGGYCHCRKRTDPFESNNKIAVQSTAYHPRTLYRGTLSHYAVCLRIGNLKSTHAACRALTAGK